MKTLDHNAISRSLHVLGYRLYEGQTLKRYEGLDYKLTEVLQQYQIDVSGIAGTGVSTDVTINFQEVLYYAPQERNIVTEDPQITGHSAVLDSGDVHFDVYVVKWLFDENVNYTGAVVRIGATEVGWAPGSAYSGTVHITFQGLGVPVEDPGYDETP